MPEYDGDAASLTENDVDSASKAIAFCDANSKETDELEGCLFEFAVKQGWPELCERLGDTPIQGGGTTTPKDYCLFMVWNKKAVDNRDSSYCNNLEDSDSRSMCERSVQMLSGSKPDDSDSQPRPPVNACAIGAGFACSDAKATKSTVQISLRQNMGRTLDPGVILYFSGDAVSCSDVDDAEGEPIVGWSAECSDGCMLISEVPWPSGEGLLVRMNGCDFSDQAIVDYSVEYGEQGGIGSVDGRAVLAVVE